MAPPNPRPPAAVLPLTPETAPVTQSRGSAAPEPAAPDRYEKLYRTLIDSIPSSVLLVDPDLRVVSANRNFFVKARLREDQVLGQRIDAVFPPALSQHINFRQRVAAVFRTGEAMTGERLVYRTPGLTARTYYYSLIPFRHDDRVEHVMLLMEDVTEKVRLSEEARRVERHLASVVESATDLVVSTDPSGRILTWNTAAVRTIGLDEADVRHRFLADLCVPQHRPALQDYLKTVSRQGKGAPIEVELVDRQGTAVPINWVGSPMLDADDKLVALVAVGRDLTERRKFEARLIQSEKLAALGVMAGGIAHEIRNPLAVVSTAAQLLLQKPLSRAIQVECAEKIYRGVQRAAGVIESLLRFARPSQKGVTRAVELGRVADEAVALVSNQLKLEHIRLTIVPAPGPVPVQGNASLIQQLIANLLLNAANAMANRGGEIELAWFRDATSAIIRVTDDGRGIPAADLPKVFDPFFTTMPVGKGTGLGLSICYAIVHQHDGAIDIVSQPGEGTVVTVSIPLDRGDGR